MNARWMLVAAAVLASGAARAEEPVAKVLMVEGSPTVVRRQVEKLPAQVDLPLQRDDELQVPPASFLVLEILKNHFVVKIDEDLVMPVKDIAVLDSAAKAQSVEKQLAAMVKAQELSHDRVTAYQNRKTAGDTAPVATENSRPRPAARVSASEAPSAQPPAPPPAPSPVVVALQPSPQLQPPAEVPAPQPKAAPQPRQDRAEPELRAKKSAMVERKERVAPVADEDMAPGAGAVHADAAPLPTRWVHVHDGIEDAKTNEVAPGILEAVKGLRGTIKAAWRNAKLKAPPVDHLLLRVKDGKVQVRLGSRLPLPAYCAARFQAFADRLPPSGWMRIDVDLAGK